MTEEELKLYEESSEERMNRIRLSLAAYAYEFLDQSIMTDAEFDALALSIQPNKSTCNEKLDEFFRTEFAPYTGSWIHKHPEKDKLKQKLKDLGYIK